MIKRIRAQLHDFPGYAKIRRVAITLEPWTLDEGLLTPTLKIKRARVLEQYEDRIAKIYG